MEEFMDADISDDELYEIDELDEAYLLNEIESETE